MVKHLFRLGLKVNVDGEFYLGTAAKEASLKVVKSLVELGANVNTKDEQGWSPLARCLCGVPQSKVFSMAKTLLDHGADVNSVNNDGHTPLIICVKRRFSPGLGEVLKMLFRRGADERVKGSDGLSVKRILLGRDWTSEETLFVDGCRIPNPGGAFYRQAAPILNRVQIWRQKKCFSEVCTTFYGVWKVHEKSTGTSTSTSSTSTSSEAPSVISTKRPRTACPSLLEVKVDVLQIIFSFLRVE